MDRKLDSTVVYFNPTAGSARLDKRYQSWIYCVLDQYNRRTIWHFVFVCHKYNPLHNVGHKVVVNRSGVSQFSTNRYFCGS